MLKKLIEQRDSKKAEMQALLTSAENETRALSEEEMARFDALEQEVKALTDTISKIESARAEELDNAGEEKDCGGETTEDKEVRAFADYVRGKATEMRTNQNITYANNGAVIPVTIAKRVIDKVKDLCPIFEKAEIYHVKGTLKIPKWTVITDTADHDVTVSYATEFSELTADAGKFISVDLSGYLVGSLVLIGRSVENNADIDVVTFIIDKMAAKIAQFIEKEMLTGSGHSNNHCAGAISVSNGVTATATSAVTADELITLQSKVKSAYQKDACWVMNNNTFTAIKKLKDSENRYLLQVDYSKEFPYMLLGKPVYLSDSMADMSASSKPILYMDFKGMAGNMREEISIQVLREKYATQHAIGVNGWFDFDAVPTNEQMIAVLTMDDGE